jgi:phosphatidylglycerophosphatase A
VSFFGLGYGPIAPATWGSFGAMVVYVVLWRVLLAPVLWQVLVVLIAAACAANLLLGSWAITHYQSRDPRPMVIDEVAGMWLSVLFVPMDNTVRAVWACAAAFFLFRIFDIVKLPPARQLERLPAGAGILCDDLAAGIQTNIVLQLVFRLLWRT